MEMGATAKLTLRARRDAKKAIPLDELKAAAVKAEIDFGERSPGRVLHYALVGMAQNGSVEKHDEKWRIKEKD